MSFESVRAASIKDVNPRTDLEARWTKPNLLRKLLNLPETKAQKTLSATVSLLQLQRLCGGGSSSPTRVMVVNRSGTKNDLCGSTEERRSTRKMPVFVDSSMRARTCWKRAARASTEPPSPEVDRSGGSWPDETACTRCLPRCRGPFHSSSANTTQENDAIVMIVGQGIMMPIACRVLKN